EIGSDGGGRLRAEEREARPRVQVDEHELTRGRDDAVASVDLEAEGGGGPAHEPRQRALIEGELPQALLLVVEPPEPRRLAVEPAPAYPIELYEVAVHVWLYHRARHAAAGHAGAGGRGRVRTPRVPPAALLRVVGAGRLPPHRLGPAHPPARGPSEAAGPEGHPRLRELGDHAIAIGGEDRRGAVDLAHAVRFQHAEG